MQYNAEAIEKGGSHVEAELVAVEQERQSFRLWRNGENGGRCLGRGGISACCAAAFRADLEGGLLEGVSRVRQIHKILL